MSVSQQTPVLDLDPFADDFLAHPYGFYEPLREAGPVVWLGRYDIWAMARYEQVFAALRDHDTYCSSANPASGSTTPCTASPPSPSASLPRKFDRQGGRSRRTVVVCARLFLRS